MRRKFVAVAVLGLWAGVPAAASACDFSFAYHFLGVPETPYAVGGGILLSPLTGDDDMIMQPGVGVGIRLGQRAGVAPLVGYCKGTGDSDDLGEIMFGAGGLFNLWNSADGMMTLNVQAHAAYTSYGEGDFDASGIVIPVMASFGYAMSETLLLYGQGGFIHDRYSEEDHDFNDTNPAFGGGVAFGAGRFDVTGGLIFQMTDGDDDLGLVAAISTGIGS
jgi:hypothetical protein